MTERVSKLNRRQVLSAVVAIPLLALPVEAGTIYPKPDAIAQFPTKWMKVDGEYYLGFVWLPMWLQTEEERGKRANNCLYPPGHPLRYEREAFPTEPYEPAGKRIGDVRWA